MTFQPLCNIHGAFYVITQNTKFLDMPSLRVYETYLKQKIALKGNSSIFIVAVGLTVGEMQLLSIGLCCYKFFYLGIQSIYCQRLGFSGCLVFCRNYNTNIVSCKQISEQKILGSTKTKTSVSSAYIDPWDMPSNFCFHVQTDNSMVIIAINGSQLKIRATVLYL